MQDELALVREDLHTLRQQRRGEAAKPQQNDRLFKTLDEDIHQLAAKEKLLMEMHAKWLEAHPPGEQSFQSACLTVVESVSVEAWKSSVGEPARPGM